MFFSKETEILFGNENHRRNRQKRGDMSKQMVFGSKNRKHSFGDVKEHKRGKKGKKKNTEKKVKKWKKKEMKTKMKSKMKKRREKSEEINK